MPNPSTMTAELEERPTLERPAAVAGRLRRLRARLARSNSALGRGLLDLLSRDHVDEETWEEVEERTLELSSPLHPPVGAAILLRLAIAPGLLLLLSLPFIDLPGPYLLLAAMPCGINTLLVAHVYGLDAKLDAQAVAWTTAIAVIAAIAAQLVWG